jgi:Putative motility protein
MDVNMTASSTMVPGSGASVGIVMLKKALDAEAQSAMILIESMAQPLTPAANLPPNLGQNINTTA